MHRRATQASVQVSAGNLRVDTVHLGDWDGHIGMYQTNTVDQVTLFQATVSVEKISKLYLNSALQQLFDILLFKIRGFHSDNGCEYVNYRMAELLERFRGNKNTALSLTLMFWMLLKPD